MTDLDGVGFVLFSPDCIVTEIYKVAIQQIQKNNLKFVKFKWVKIDYTIIDKLYNKNRNTKNHHHSLVQSLFNQGYSLACIVKSTSQFKSFPVVQFLKNLKGPTDPAQFHDIHLRKIFGAENKVMNYIHSSDTTHDVQNESALFFSDFTSNDVMPFPIPPKYKHRESTSIYYAIYHIKLLIYEKFRKIDSIHLEDMFNQEREISVIRVKNKTHIKNLEKTYQLQHDCVTDNDIFDKQIQNLFKLILEIKYTKPYIKQILNTCKKLNVAYDNWDEITLKSQAIQGDPKIFLKCHSKE